MRIWQRSATLCTGASGWSWSVTRSVKLRMGDAENGTASAFSTLKSSSGMNDPSAETGPLFQFGEVPAELVPDLRPAPKTAPMHPDQPHQLVAFVDGGDVILTRVPNAICQQRLHVRL